MADVKTFNPADFVLIRKSLIDEYLRTTIELNKSILWLKAERERLIEDRERILNQADELDASAQKLMRMYRELEQENKTLLEDNKKLFEAMRGFGKPGSEGMN